MIGMRRREFITLLGGAAAAWPLTAQAQQVAKPARIGFLGVDTQSGIASRLERFRAGLRELGYVEGENILLDFRWAEGNYARLAEFATELVRLKVEPSRDLRDPRYPCGQTGNDDRADCHDC